MEDTEKGKVDIMKLLQDKEFLEVLSKAINLLLSGPISLWEKHLECKNEQYKEQVSLEKEKLSYQKDKLNSDAKENEVEERVTTKWLWYSGILFFLSLLTVSILGWQKVISEGVTGTILAGIIGYVFGKGTGKREQSE